MKATDINLTIFIILIFIALYAINILSIGVSNIKDNWPTYRCNPAVMPFAAAFGQDATQNFTHCIQTMQTNYMGYLTQPIHYNLSVMGDTMNTLTSSLQSARAFISNIRDFITNIVQNIFGVFLNILIEFQKITVSIKDLMGKLVGILATLLYTLDGSVKTMNSVWNGIPGKTVRSLQNVCFHPNTLIKLADNTIVNIKDVPLNARLKNGSIVQAVMNISNIKEDNTQREALFEVPCGENNNKIFVTGSHLIYDPKHKHFISVKDFSLTNSNILQTNVECPVLNCLITSDHTIPIGDWIFHDWEDNNGSISKSLER
jgi:hypothetical protein